MNAWPEAGENDCLVLARGPSATLDYIVEPELEALGLRPCLVDTRYAPPPAGVALPGARWVVVVRYLPAGWPAALRRLRSAGRRIAYLLDDDLFSAAAVNELPRPYRLRVRTEALQRRRDLKASCDEFWVSTPYLMQQYADWSPRLTPARPTKVTQACHPAVWMCYHGTASHAAELDWLGPLALALLERNPDLHFEVFGDHPVYKRFKGLPRTRVLHPMPWPAYRAHTASGGCDIGLAPLLPGRFNAGRGPVKVFDFARLGAAGLYSDREPYRSAVHHGLDGLLLPDDRQAWIDAVETLLADAPRRAHLVAAARSRIAGWPGRSDR